MREAMVSKELMEIMACPFCISNLLCEGERLVCSNPECGCRYRVEEGVPIMLIDEAERPCPKCGNQRLWEEDILRCASCGCELRDARRQ